MADGIERERWICDLGCQSGGSSAGLENSARGVAPIPPQDDENEGPGKILCMVATNGPEHGKEGKPM